MFFADKIIEQYIRDEIDMIFERCKLKQEIMNEILDELGVKDKERLLSLLVLLSI